MGHVRCRTDRLFDSEQPACLLQIHRPCDPTPLKRRRPWPDLFTSHRVSNPVETAPWTFKANAHASRDLFRISVAADESRTFHLGRAWLRTWATDLSTSYGELEDNDRWRFPLRTSRLHKLGDTLKSLRASLSDSRHTDQHTAHHLRAIFGALRPALLLRT